MKYDNKQQTGGYGGCLLWILIIITIYFCSCTKTDYGYLNTDRRGLHKYEFWIDHYNKDTTVMGVRTLFEHKFEPAGTSTNIGVDWFLNCATDSIEHWYYKVDGVGYETKLRPTRVDTNWVNYSK